ncbi:cupin domain-containing protein [Halorhabdus rudnickae]|uniref:cupin domain-containing protein n=1 Tax=Halorhabdus rudnickae TaxID=1775544 RepID=UPI001082D415|nr:cupin domain-containing protein [Halorhabdus rudnickae]
MNKLRIDDVENAVQPAAVMRQLTDPLGTTDLAINYYELEPGDSFAFAYHNHEVQEEVFYIQEGTATFETEDGPIVVEEGELIRFDRGEFQRGWNRGDDRVRALALGAPLAYGEQRKLRYCSNCDEQTHNRLASENGDTTIVAYCTNCGGQTGEWYEGSMQGEVP